MGLFDFVGDQISSGFKQITGQREGILGSAIDNFVPYGSAARDLAGGVSGIVKGSGGSGQDGAQTISWDPSTPSIGGGGFTSPISRPSDGMMYTQHGSGGGLLQQPGGSTSNAGPSWLERRLKDLGTISQGVEIGEDIYEDISGRDDDRGRDRGDSENYSNQAWSGAGGGFFSSPVVQLGGGLLAALVTAKALDL